MESGLSWMQLYLLTHNMMQTPVSLTADAIKPPNFAYNTFFFFFFNSAPQIRFPFRRLCLGSFLSAAVLKALFLSVSAGLFSCTYIHTNTSLLNAVTSSTICPHCSRFRVYFCFVLETCITSSKNYLDSVILNEGWWLLPSASMTLLPVLNNNTAYSPCLCPYRVFYLFIFHLSLYCFVCH